MQLGLEQEDPAARSTSAAAKRRHELTAKDRRRDGVRLGRPRTDVEHAVDQLGYLVCRSVEDILVRGTR
jgi:hypothetical protein